VAILLFHRGLSSIISLQKVWQTLMSTIGSVEMVEDEFESLAENREPNGTRTLAALSSGIELRSVSFMYEEKAGDVLRGIDLTIPANRTIALVGESGAGKSTMVDLLTLLLKPRTGEIYIDGIPGRDVELGSWRRQIGYVSQETIVFDDTIAANIALSDLDQAEDPEAFERVRAAARRAYIDHYINELPDGYATVVGDRGVRLSGGQRQRLFIARELFKEPNLLILDEATSALDSESERFIQESIDGLKGSMTVVIIAHRLSTIRNADHVFVLDQGRVIEHGAYDELIDRSASRFREMVELQQL
jgi:subfamily B ATP-binding cassette protein MsbA